ncbi:MAG: aspartate dehydrogenase [Rhodospirillales bacterium]
MEKLRVAVGGLGAIGFEVARSLDRGLPGLSLVAVSARDPERAQARLAAFSDPPPVLPLEALAAEAEILVECAPAAVFDRLAKPAVEAGRTLLVLSAGTLLSRSELIEGARASRARLLVPSGAMLGLDAIRAAAEGTLASVTIVTRKPPNGLQGAPYLVAKGIDLTGLAEPLQVYSGPVREAALHFPANVNVAAAVALAGIGPDRTRLEVWADPAIERNTHRVDVVSDSADFTMTISGRPSLENPRTGRLTPLSVIAALRRLTEPLVVGT